MRGEVHGQRQRSEETDGIADSGLRHASLSSKWGRFQLQRFQSVEVFFCSSDYKKNTCISTDVWKFVLQLSFNVVPVIKETIKYCFEFCSLNFI